MADLGRPETPDAAGGLPAIPGHAAPAGPSDPADPAIPGHAPAESSDPAIPGQAAPAGSSDPADPAIPGHAPAEPSDPAIAGHAPAAGPAAERGAEAFRELVTVMARLRAPGGCPWDREQDHRSLAIHLIEESYEVLDAIDRNDMADLQEELGDLLLQVVFHAQMASDAGAFEVGDVLDDLVAKLVHRHPHVFGTVTVSGAREVVANWEALRYEQKARTSLADGIPKDLPALLYAHKVQRRLSGAGVGTDGSVRRVAGMAAALAGPGGATDETLGALLYEVVAVARDACIDPEGALRRAANRELGPR